MTDRPAGGRRLAILLGAALAVAVVAIGAALLFGGPGRQTETGIVVSVQATSLTNVQGFSIRTSDGRTVAFRIEHLENAASFAPSHLAEHTATLVPVIVTYVRQGDSNVAVRLEDAR